MEQIISTILEMDKKARDMEANAEADRANIQAEITARKKELYDHYDESLKEILEMNRINAQEDYEAGKIEIDKNAHQIIKKMNSLYDENGQEWVSKIVGEVTGEE